MENDENLDPNVWFNEPDTHIRCVVDVILKKKYVRNSVENSFETYKLLKPKYEPFHLFFPVFRLK